MIFVDTNAVMFAVGRPHPLREPARKFFRQAVAEPRVMLCTSAEVLQELLHAYLAVRRMETLDAALRICETVIDEIWSVESEDVLLARTLVGRYRALAARDLLHLACCRRRNVPEVHTYDRALAAAFQ